MMNGANRESAELIRRWGRKPILCAGGLALIAVVYIAFPNPRVDLTRFNCDDSEAYIGLAHSIATGRGYTRCLNPDQYIAHKTWPPGLPFLLCPAIGIFGLNLLAMKLTIVAIGLIGLCFFYLLVRDLTDHRLAVWATTAAAGSAYYFGFSHQVMSEVPTFAVGVAALWCVQRALREPDRWRWWVLAGTIVGFGALVKGFALLLIPTPLVVIRRVERSRRRGFLIRYAVFGAMAFAPAAAWAWRNSRVQAGSVDGINQFRMLLQVRPNDPNSPLVTPRQLARQVYENLSWGLIYNLPEQTVPLVRLLSLRERRGGQWIAVGASILVVAACVLSARRHLWPLHLYLVAVLVLLVMFRTGGSARYFVPVAPMTTFLFAVAVRESRWWSKLRRGASVVAAIWLAAAGIDLGVAVYQQETRPYADTHWAEFVDIALKARDRLGPEATVCVHNANAFAILSGRRTWMIQPGMPFDLESALQSGRITHVVASRYTPARDAERSGWVRTRSDRFERVASNTGYDILRWK